MDPTVLVVGVPVAFGADWRLRGWRTVKYRERWKEALKELDEIYGELDEGSTKPVKATGEPALKKKRQKDRTMIQVGSIGSVNFQAGGSLQIQVDPATHGMASWDRRDLEIERAKKGLPPADDLRGLASWDKREVLRARVKYANRSKE